MRNFIAFIFLNVLNAVLSQNCRSDWISLTSCMKDRYNDYSAQRRLSDNDRTNVENKIRDCYLQQECQDPFPNASIAIAAKDCYLDTQPRVRQDLQTCVQKEFKDFNMQEDDSLAYLWMQDEVYIKAAEGDSKVCGAYTNQNNLNLCVTKVIEDAFTNPNQKQDMCEVRRQCSQQVSQSCMVRWREKIKPKLCTCISDQKKMNGYKNQYKICVESKNSVLSDLDAYAKFLDNFKTKLCGPKTDPCGADNQNKTSTSTQSSLGSLFGQLGGGGSANGGGSNTGNSNTAVPNLLGNLAKLVTGSGGSLFGGTSTNGASSSGSNSASVPNVGISSLTNFFNSLTGGSNLFGSASSGNNNAGLTGLTNILTQGNPVNNLKQILSDTPSFGSLKGDGGYGSLLGGSGTSYDFVGNKKVVS